MAEAEEEIVVDLEAKVASVPGEIAALEGEGDSPASLCLERMQEGPLVQVWAADLSAPSILLVSICI